MSLDRKLFDQTFNRLAVAMRDNRTDTATKEVYFRALEEFTSHQVSAAALLLAQEPDRRFFPTTGEWIASILTIRAESERALLARPVNRAEPWVFECENCDDTGWESRSCEGIKDFGGPVAFCGRRKPHYPHTYVTICPCRETNRTYQRNNVQERKRG